MEAILPILIPVTFFVMFFSERLFPGGRTFVTPPRFRLKGVLFFFLSAAINAALPALVVGVVGEHTPLHLGWLGVAGGAVLAFLVGDLANYGVHRTQHRFLPLWRWTHQWHHSVEAVDMGSAAVLHPLDIALTTVVGAIIPTVLGVSAEAAALAGYVGFFYAMFQHWNVRTPQWLGYVIQRPESHCVHHERGVHAYNYGNFPLWDILFGTFRNPATWAGKVGFWDGASTQMGRMLLGRDVGQPPRASTAAAALRPAADREASPTQA